MHLFLYNMHTFSDMPFSMVLFSELMNKLWSLNDLPEVKVVLHDMLFYWIFHSWNIDCDYMTDDTFQ